MSLGIKYDGEKPHMSLIPPRAAIEVAKVLTVGASKYSPDNWRHVVPIRDRYLDATFRHIFDCMIQYKASEYPHDEETGLHHLAHAICCLLFVLEHDLMTEDTTNEEDQKAGTRESLFH